MEFVTLSYNQADFIIQHLESIKYVVNKYSKGEKCFFRLFDDASSDATVALVKLWISKNKDLFNHFEINVNESNIGVANNYANALESLTSNRFKILAGDDIYFDQDIFALANNDGIVLTPVIGFEENNVFEFLGKGNYCEMVAAQTRGKLLQQIKTMMSFGNCICAPGAFFDKKMLNDKLFSYIREFRNIDDYPMWIYLLKYELSEDNICVLDVPYIMYRSGSGVSTINSSEKRNNKQEEYDSEVLALKQKETPLLYETSIHGAFARFFNALRVRWYEKVAKHYNKDVREFCSVYRKYACESKTYLRMITNNSSEFINQNGL